MGELMRAVETAREAQDPYLDGLTFEGETIDEGCDLTFFELHGLELTRCSLVGANLTKASFYDSTLVECDLTGANLTNAFLARTRLIDCKLEGAVFTGAILRSCRLKGCQCRYVSAGEAKLEGTTLADCDLTEAFLSDL